MKKITFIFILLYSSLFTVVHAQYFIGLKAGSHYSSLYNKADKKSELPLKYTTSYGYTYGIDYANRIKRDTRFNLSLLYTTTNQQYHFDKPIASGNHLLVNDVSIMATSRLQHIRIPIYILWSNNFNAEKCTKYIGLGFYVGKLLNYTDINTYKNNNPSTDSIPGQEYSPPLNEKYYFHNGTYEWNSYTFSQKRILALNTWMYNKYDIGLNVKLGFMYKLAKNIQLVSEVQYTHSVFNIENNTLITAKDSIGITTDLNFNARGPVKYNTGSEILPNNNRQAKTYIIQAGLSVGVIYKIPRIKNNKPIDDVD